MANYREDNQSFMMYKDWEEIFEEYTDEQAGELIKALFAFAKRGEITEFSTSALKIAFIIMSRQIDRDGEKWQETCRRRSENVKKRWEKQNTKDTNEYNCIQTHTNDTDKDKVTDTVTDKDKVTDTVTDKDKDNKIYYVEEIKEIIDYLNAKCKTSYRATSANTKKHITARLKEKYTVDDFKTVIDKKVDEWQTDSKMSTFLRPETLFGSKFENYLNQPSTKQLSKNQMSRLIPDDAL